MPRFSAGARVLENRIARIENRRSTTQLPKALREYSLHNTEPENDLLKERVKLFITAFEAMKATLPKPK